MSHGRPIRIGTRGSRLARWQSEWTAERLRELGAEVEIVEIVTQGDVQQRGPVANIGAPGVFTKEIQAALMRGEVDLAVHSLKDLPTQPVEGLHLAATPERELPFDAVVSNGNATLGRLIEGALVGCGSLRRKAQLLAIRPDLRVESIRGNVDSRVWKLSAGQYDALVLAAAGLIRIGWKEHIAEVLEPPRFLPAPGQGALAIECRVDDAETFNIASQLNDPATRLAVEAERAFLARLEGGCSAPVAAWGRIDGGELKLDGLVASLDGQRVLRNAGGAPLSSGPEMAALQQAVQLGHGLAEAMLAQGAGKLVVDARSG